MKRSLIALLTIVFAVSSTPAAYCPGVQTITDCPDEGCGPNSDPELNKRKNIRSDDQQPVLRSISWMKGLAEPKNFTADGQNRDELIQLGEGQKITVVAYALYAKPEGKETCNCGLTAQKDTDNHIVMVDPGLKNPTLDAKECSSVTAEFTPRVRLDHPNFTGTKLNRLIDPAWHSGDVPNGKLLVRVTGLLVFDSYHFLHSALVRENDWEIHPVLKMEYCPEEQTCQADSDANWLNLEDE
jgi:hypothetical protein